MTDAEFDILDELYFVTGYHDLFECLDFDHEVLVSHLKSMHNKGLIKVLSSHDDEVKDEALDIAKDYQAYFFLATKSGLLAHNSK